MLKPYEYNRIKSLTFDLVNIYHSVNDKSTVNAVYAQVASEILALTDLPEIEKFLSVIESPKLSREQAEKLLLDLKPLIEPFPLMTENQMRKIFKKVKKLKIPATTLWDMREVTYFAWNEVSSGRKYILTADGHGFYGTMSGSMKNICAICKKTSIVTQFLAVTKTGADGTYTKNGTYICLDSDKCNQQVQSIQGLQQFLEIIREK
ncbi:MAG: FusB/FusC family EF-G-binding protein [Streptococcaceae bacterium]|nr:FusB/FusC family EF-G-binding protein [Streptococcaceae bacterium]